MQGAMTGATEARSQIDDFCLKIVINAIHHGRMFISVRTLFLTMVVTALLVGCAIEPPPGVSPDLLAAEASADPVRSLALMREQGERFAHRPFLAGNRVDLLINGPASFAALAEAIRSAHTRVDMESYEFDDAAGGEFSDILLAARQRGVEVNLIYDAWGANDTSAALFQRLRQGGVRVLEYNPLTPNARVPVEVNARPPQAAMRRWQAGDHGRSEHQPGLREYAGGPCRRSERCGLAGHGRAH